MSLIHAVGVLGFVVFFVAIPVCCRTMRSCDMSRVLYRHIRKSFVYLFTPNHITTTSIHACTLWYNCISSRGPDMFTVHIVIFTEYPPLRPYLQCEHIYCPSRMLLDLPTPGIYSFYVTSWPGRLDLLRVFGACACLRMLGSVSFAACAYASKWIMHMCKLQLYRHVYIAYI